MSQSSPQSDPSMDEILASIRRIIAEEEGDSAAPTPQAPQPAAPAEAAAEESEENVLELTEEVEVEDEDEILTLSEEIIEEERQPSEQEVVEPEIVEQPVAEPEPEELLEPEPEEQLEAEPEEQPAALASERESAPTKLSLMSEETERRALEALRAAMAQGAREPEPVQEPEPSPAVAPELDEEQLKAVMAPMVREWLDENLPNLVERVVRDEVARLFDRNRGA